MLVGTVNARAVLFQGLAHHTVTIEQLEMSGTPRQLQKRVGLDFIMYYLLLQLHISYNQWHPVKLKPCCAILVTAYFISVE